MNLYNLLQTAIGAAIGTSVGLAIGLHHDRVDDLVKTKHLLVVDDDDKTWVDASDAGISVYGKQVGDFSQIRAGQHPYMAFSVDGEQKVTVGEMTYANAVGIATWEGGNIRSYFGATPSDSTFALYAGKDPMAPKSLLDGNMERLSAIRATAHEDASAELVLAGKTGGTKRISNSDSTSNTR